MTIYLIIFAALALLAIGKFWRPDRLGTVPCAIALILTVFVGYRYQIGVDWVTYELIFLDISRMPLLDAVTYGDSGYSVINWLVSRFGGQVWHVNLVCATIFFYALIRFCAALPRPGLVIATAVPTLIIVTAMGYTRQATALGFIMLAYVYFHGKMNWRWIACLCVAILFHRSAIFMLPIFLIAGSNRPALSLAIGGLLITGLLFTIVLQNVNDVLSLYFEGDIESSGAIPRIAIGAAAGLCFFLTRNRTVFGPRETLVRNMSIALIAMLPLYFVIPSTTVVDRIGILLLPFQSAVLAGLTASLEQKPVSEGIVTSLILGAYGGVLLIWLLYATFTSYWIPYENVLFVKWA